MFVCVFVAARQMRLSESVPRPRKSTPVALKSGGHDNGKPGLRADCSANYYAGFVVDPDGYRIELVQWPAGHADGITAADFP